MQKGKDGYKRGGKYLTEENVESDLGILRKCAPDIDKILKLELNLETRVSISSRMY